MERRFRIIRLVPVCNPCPKAVSRCACHRSPNPSEGYDTERLKGQGFRVDERRQRGGIQKASEGYDTLRMLIINRLGRQRRIVQEFTWRWISVFACTDLIGEQNRDMSTRTFNHCPEPL